jgi:hypothetical protein
MTKYLLTVATPLLLALSLTLLPIPGKVFTYSSGNTEDFTDMGQGYLIADGVPYVAPSVEILNKISWCESKNNDLAQNPNSTARGRFQIIKGTEELVERNTGKDYDAFDPEDALEMSLWLYQRYKCRPWRASFNCHQCL